MSRRTVRSRTAGLIVPVVGSFVVAYFVWHGLHGAYGFWSAVTLDEQAVALEADLSDLRDERRKLELSVLLLRRESLDPDLLDERARSLLNRAHPDDVVILLDGE